MKALIGIVLMASLALAGCATTSQNPQQAQQIAQADQRVRQAIAANKAGQIKESEVSRTIYEEAAKLGNTELMKIASFALENELAYESGKITKSQYKASERKAQIALNENVQARNRARQQQQQYKRQQFNRNLNKVALGMQAFGNGFNARRPVTCSSDGFGMGRTVTCY